MAEPRAHLMAYDQLMDLARGLRAELVMTANPRGVDSNASAHTALQIMERERFDQLPVIQEGEVAGLLRREHLETANLESKVINLAFESVSFKNTLPINAHLGWVLDILCENKSCLVRDSNDAIVGLIHISDLNRHPVRLYFYLMISAAEMGMAEIIARVDAGELWYRKIPDKNRWNIFNFYCKQARERVEISRLNVAGFADLVAALRTLTVIRGILVRDTDDERILASIQKPGTSESPRNQVMHLTKILVNEPDDVRKLNDTAHFLIRFLRRIEDQLEVNPPPTTVEDVPRSISALTERWAVEMAISEFDCLKRDAFLSKYGFGKSKLYFLVEKGKEYDSKAIVGAAFGFQHPHAGPLKPSDFSGGKNTVQRKLEELGFTVAVNKRG